MRPEMEAIYLAAILDLSDDAIIAQDLGGTVISWNGAAERIFGYTADEMVGRSIAILLPPDRRDEEERIVDKIKGGMRIERFETVRCAKDGHDIQVSLVISLIRDAEGVVVGIVKILRDVSERERTSKELRLRADAFEKAAFGIAIVDGKTNAIQFANSTFANMLGMTIAELRQMKIGEVYAPEERAYLMGLAATIDRTGHLAFDSQHVRKDGSIYPAHMDVTSVRGDDGSVLYRIASAFDITEQKRAEHELHETQRRSQELLALLDTLQSAAPIGIAFIDRNYRFVRVNEAVATINGVPGQNLVGRLVREVVPDLWPQIEPTYRAVVEEGKSFLNVEVHLAMAMPEAEARHRLVSYYPVRIRDEIIGIGVIVVDVTDQKRLEQRLIQAQKMEAIGSLTGGMAHDFNNLLSIIIGNLGLVRESGTIGPALEPLLADALDAAERGADLIGHLLAFARRQPLQPQRVDLNHLVTRIVRLLSRTLGEAIETSLDLASDVWPVVVDPAQLEATLTNLATNARDAMPGGGRLMIATSNQSLDADYAARHPEVVPGDYAVIKVSDTGAGMTPEVMSHIFEPFFTTKAEGRGTGLGLSMVFGFMKQSGGHINVYSELGHGTTIRLYLPRAGAQAQTIEKVETAHRARGGGERVLAVEDNAAMRRVVVRQLTELGYEVIEAQSAAAAIAVLESQTIDLLFTDIVMPGDIDGFELARRAIARWPKVKIVLTSGFPETRLNGDRGAMAAEMRLLSKPYRKDDLARVLREALDS